MAHRNKSSLDYVSLGCCALALLLYINTLNSGFVYDDRRAVLGNPDVVGASPWYTMFQNDFWGTALTDSGSHGSYRPVCVFSFRLNYLLGGFKPAGYHLVNVVLHCLATLLVIQLARRLHPHGAGVAGLVFATHPVHTEAVAGIVGRADLIACNLYLLAFLSYMKHVDWRENGASVMHQWTALGATLLSSSMAVLCKETAVTALVICAIYDIIKGFTGYKDKARLRSLGILFLAMGLILHFRLNLPKPTTNFSTADNPTAKISSIWTRFFTFAYLPLFNFKLLLYPSKLSFDWGMDAIPRVTSIFDVRTLLSALFYTILIRTVWSCVNNLLSTAAQRSTCARQRKKSPSMWIPTQQQQQYTHAAVYSQSFEMQLRPTVPECCSVCKHGLNVRHSSSCRANNNNNVPAPNAPPCGCPSLVTLSPSATYISSSGSSNNNNNNNNSFNNNNNSMCYNNNNNNLNGYTNSNSNSNHYNNHKFSVHTTDTHKYFTSYKLGGYRRSVQSTPTSSRDSSASRAEQSEFSDSARILIALAFMVLPFLPATNLFFYVGFVVAERILYLPSVGYCLLIGFGYNKLASISSRSDYYKRYSKRLAVVQASGSEKFSVQQQQQQNQRTRNKLLIVCICIISLVYSVKTIDRNFDWKDEESLYRSAININPPKALGNLGSVLSAQGRNTEAKEALMEALKYRPNMADVHYNLGVLLQSQQDHKGAVDSFQMAIHFRPSLAVAYLNLGTSLVVLGRCQEAAQVLREGSRLDGTGLRDRAAHDNARVASLLQLGNLYADQGKLQRALAIYREALHNLPERYPPQGIYHRLGDIFAKLHQWPEAERFQLAALDAQPDHIGAHISYGAMLAKNNSRIGEAEQWFRRALRLAPADASVYHHYADFLQLLNRDEEACTNRVRAAELNQNDYSLIVGAATCLRMLDQKLEAEKWYRMAVKLKPDDARAHTNLGAILHLLGRNRQASTSYKEALRLQPNDPTTLANLAKLSVSKTLKY